MVVCGAGVGARDVSMIGGGATIWIGGGAAALLTGWIAM